MSEQDYTAILQYPDRDDRTGWQAYWQQQGQLWRSEPEIPFNLPQERPDHENRYPSSLHKLRIRAVDAGGLWPGPEL